MDEFVQRYAILVAAFLPLLVVGCATFELPPLHLVQNGHARAAIIVPDDAARTVVETAYDLSQIISKISGSPLSIASYAPAGPALVLGVHERDSELEPLEYHVWREDSVLYFSGGSDQGVINGVYAFLEEEFGCRWYIPGPLGEYIPKQKTISVGQVNLQDAPDFESITGFGRYDTDPEVGRLWSRRNRLDGFPWQMPSHNWQNIMPWSLFEEHPEWFALAGKGRTPLQMCTTHPDVLDTTVAKARRYFDRNPDAPSFSLSPTDNMSFCRCENCRALDVELGIDPFAPGNSITDRLVYFFNQVAAEVEKTHPDRRLAFFAYLNHTEPPQVVRPHQMLLPFLVHTPWDYCMHHPIEDPDCERNRVFAKIVIGWEKLSPGLYLYDYWGHYNLCGHHGVVHNIKADLPWLHRHGVVGFYGEMHPQRWTQPLNFYLPPKLTWDVDTDVETIVSEFYENMFGPAAPAVAKYSQMFEDVMAEVPKDTAQDYERAFVHGMTPDFFARAGALLDSADNTIRNGDIAPDEKADIAERLRRFRYGMRLAQRLALVKQKRFADRLCQVTEQLDSLKFLLDEIAAYPELAGMIELPAAIRQAKSEREKLPPYGLIWEQAVPSPERRAELRQGLDKGHTREVARALGYISDWHVVGLWTYPGGDPLSTHFPPEDGVDLSDSYNGRSGEIRWQFYRGESPYGIVDLRKHFRPEDTQYTGAYLYSEIELLTDADVRLEPTWDDDVAMWINDQLVFSNRRDDVRSISVRLSKGKNRLLAKVTNKQHGFKFSLRIVSEDGRPHNAVVWE